MWKKSDKQIDYEKLTKEEAVKIFKKLLSELGVTSTWHWEDCRRVIQNQERAKALRTLHDQKRAFTEFTTEYRHREREEARQKRKHLKEQFKEMLDESKIIFPLSKYYDVLHATYCRRPDSLLMIRDFAPWKTANEKNSSKTIWTN